MPVLSFLRHTTASWLIAAGADVKTVQTIMRHSDIKLTLDRYGHLFPGSEAAAVERIRGAFTQSVELRQTGTTAVIGVQHLVQQSERFSTRKGANACDESTAVETIAFNRKSNEKTGETQETPGFISSAPARGRTYCKFIGEPKPFDNSWFHRWFHHQQSGDK